MAAQANTASLNTNLNVSPYYDDFDERKNFNRLVYQPGRAVQARELTQMQTILQNQIDRFAESIYKEGSAVRGCAISPLDNRYNYVKLKDNSVTGSSVNVYSFLDRTVKGGTSGVIAKVVNVNDGSQANTPNYKTFFVNYISSNTATGYKTFANNETLTDVAGGVLKANTINADSTGLGSSIRIESGIIFAKDHFIRVDDQIIILDKYSNSPTYRVGYTIQEEIVTSVEDSSLLDPANGAYNYAAPGADRLKLTAVLTKQAVDTENSNNFVEFVNIKNGVIQTKSDQPQYSAIRDEMAKRTKDESGDYIVKGLTTRAREHFDDGTNGGVYTTGNTSLLSIDVEPGKAYVQGYDNELLVSQHVAIDKGIDYSSVEGSEVYADFGNYIIVDNVVGNWDVNGQDVISLRGRGVGVSGQANAISTGNYSTGSAAGAQIGTARVRGVEYLSGTPGLPSGQFKLYLTDIKITTAGKSFANVEGVAFDATAGLADGRADVINANNRNANTTDSFFNSAVYLLPANAIRRLRTSAGAVNATFGFNKLFNAVTFNSSGVMSLDTTSENGSASETPYGSGTLSSGVARENYMVIVRSTSANTSNLTGTVTVTSGSNTVTGSGTAFTTQVSPGDIIACSAADKLIVSEVTSATVLKLVSNAPANRAGAFHKRFIQGQILDMAGNGRNGARSVSVSGTTATIDIKEPTSAGFNASVIMKLQKTDAQEASKATVRSRLVQIKMGASGTTGYTANTSGPWPLGIADGFKLVSVRKKTGSRFTTTSEGTDVTSGFTLDTGQRDNFYDHARLVKSNSTAVTVGASDYLLVTLDYFSHSNRDRGYFSVDSYPINDATAGANSQVIFTYQVPVFSSPVTGISYDLRNCVDFRPRLADTANNVTAISNISTNPLGLDTPVYTMSSTDYTEPSGGLRFPYPASLFETDLQYYLSRKDLIVINKDGVCEAIRGVPSNTPLAPSSDANKMTLAQITVAPYPSLPDDVAKRVGRTDLSNTLKTVKNDRFTMRDIGVIRDRVDRLEYYTTLSLLEKDAQNMTITDANGNDRFKNGFLVDSFIGHAVGNVYDPDYKIAIDPENREARPSAKIDNIELFYNAANSSSIVRTNVTQGNVSRDQIVYIANSQATWTPGSSVSAGGVTATLRFKVNNKLYVEGASGNFVQGGTITNGVASSTISSVRQTTPGRLMTLPYTHEPVIQQIYGTTTRNASGLAYSWIGSLGLNPNSDYWVDTTQLPDVQINIDNNADAWEAMANAYGTNWGSWNTVATGTPVLQAQQSRNVDTNSTRIRNGTWRIDGVTVTDQTYSTAVRQQQVGTSLGVTLNSQTQTVGNIVKDVNIQPFMRSRVIKVTGRGLKPSSRFYAFFDSTAVSAYITPCNSLFANTGNEGAKLYSTANGDIHCTFRIPNSAALKFRTGEKIFRLSDNFTDETEPGLETSAAQATYAAQGLTTQTQDLTISTVQADVSVNTTTRTRTVNDISTVQTTTAYSYIFREDPICQSFKVDMGSFGRVTGTGGFITKIDLFFSTKDAVQPCIVEIRELDPISGYPTPKVVPYSRRTLEPEEINTSDGGGAATPVYFPSPVFVENGKSYAITIIPGGGSPNFALHIARLGDIDVQTGNRVAAQPAAGMLFASSNDSTYTALQTEDLKFRIYFANFDTSVTGSIILKNEAKDYLTIANQNTTVAFTTMGEEVHGETYLKGTFVAGQGLTGNVAAGLSFAQGMTSGATGTITYLSTANGEVRVRDVSATKFRGGEAVRFRLASISGTISGNSTGGIKFAQYPKGHISHHDTVTGSNTLIHIANVSFGNSGPASGSSANNKFFMSNHWIKGQATNDTAKIVSLDTLKADLLSIKGDFISPSNTSIIPYGKFATSTSSRDASYNLINLNNDTVFASRRYILSKSVESNTALSSSTMKDGSLEVKLDLATNNRYASPVFDTSRISATIVQSIINNSTTGEANAISGGDASARYITRRVTLDDGQDAEDLSVYFDGYRPSGSDFNVYYKVINGEDSDSFDKARWIAMDMDTASTTISSSENKFDFKEFRFSVPSYPTGAGPFHSGVFANSSPANVLCYRNSVGAFYVGFKYFAIKIVLTGTNTTNPPRIRNLRAIALQK